MSQQTPFESGNTDPRSILDQIRKKLEQATQEYSAGRLNAVQFNAIYRHYTEKRMIIEKLIERNPETDAWRAAASPGKTSFLKDRFESRPLFLLVLRRGDRQPLMTEGKVPKKAAEQIHKMLQVVWKMQTWRQGLARKSLGDGLWLLLVMGAESLTLVVYFFQPSTLQTNHLRDLHSDFERANYHLLERGAPADKMVFPQRALLQTQPE